MLTGAAAAAAATLGSSVNQLVGNAARGLLSRTGGLLPALPAPPEVKNGVDEEAAGTGVGSEPYEAGAPAACDAIGVVVCSTPTEKFWTVAMSSLSFDGPVLAAGCCGAGVLTMVAKSLESTLLSAAATEERRAVN